MKTNTTKALLAAMIVAAGIVSFTACGNKEEAATETPAATEAPAEAAPAEEAAAPAADSTAAAPAATPAEGEAK